MLQISRHYNVRYPNITVAIAPCIGWLPSDHLDHVMLPNQISIVHPFVKGETANKQGLALSMQYKISECRYKLLSTGLMITSSSSSGTMVTNQ